MELSNINAISEFAMRVENMRMQAAATNIAFANQISGSPTSVYSPLSVNIEGMQNIQTKMNSFDQFIENLNHSVTVTLESNADVKPVHQPDNELADSAGFVYKPNVNLVNEMLTLTTATRAYEANIRAFNTARDMSAKALEIGK